MVDDDRRDRLSLLNRFADSQSSTSRRRLLKYLGATGVAASLAGCSGGGSGTTTQGTGGTTQPTQQAERTHGGTFISASTNTTNGVNVFRIGDGETSDRALLVMDTGYTNEGPEYDDFLPLWFDQIEVKQPINEVEITLRDNLKFGEGYGELTADDYLWCIDNLWKADWASFTYAKEFYVGKNDDPIQFEKVDKYTIRETIPDSRPFFPYNEPLSDMFPIPKGLAKPYVDSQDAEGLAQDESVMKATFNGNLGPWDLKRWSQQSVMAFERADEYYLRKWAKEDDRVPEVLAEAPYFDEYHIQYFDKSQTARQALQAGEIDTAYIPSTQVGTYKQKDDLKLYKNPYRSWSGYLGINHRANGWTQLRNKKVRHAMAHIYNNQYVVENILDGRAGVQNTLYPTWGPYYPEEDAVTFDDSLEKAKQLLKEGTSSDYGYDGGKLLGPEGEQVELTVVYQSGETDDLRAAYLKQRLDQVGIELKQETTSWTNLLGNYFQTSQKAEGFSGEIGYGDDNVQPSAYNKGPWDEAVSAQPWDFMLTLGFDYGPLTPAGTIASLFGERENFNAYGYSPSKDLAEMRDEAQTADTREAAASTIREMLAFISEERPVIFEYNPYNYYAYRNDVHGIGQSPPESYFANLQNRSSSRMFFSNGESGR
ncbi:ABC transporter substrate-binding protein [Halocalculus aciditolerans]|uniref:Peptide-binding protein n=1 Tax=Halocalculus aciditolerans TaxID=1383812 RepID=A0A830FJN0_9EURY|nr:ABC transporter substrate-binding protein [Halocalculus aciditolerans]GGL59064.1 peptide-binding protein [Halocalculus aciditolerans]